MDDWIWLYLLTRLNALNVVFGVTAFVSGALLLWASIAYTIMTVEARSHFSSERSAEWADTWWKVVKRSVAVFVPAVVLVAATPDTRDAMFIVGGSTLLEISRTDDAKRIAGKSVQAVEKPRLAVLRCYPRPDCEGHGLL